MLRHYREFMGAKLALFVGPSLLVLQRDCTPGLLWPGHWDLPGGGRDSCESPLACALRETHEEFTIHVPPSAIGWARAYTNSVGATVWFFVGAVPGWVAAQVRLGDEGQDWALMAAEEFLNHPKAVPQFKPRLRDYFRGVISELPVKDPPLA